MSSIAGRIVLSCSMEEFETRYVELMVFLKRWGGAALNRCTSGRYSADILLFRWRRPPATGRAGYRAAEHADFLWR